MMSTTKQWLNIMKSCHLVTDTYGANGIRSGGAGSGTNGVGVAQSESQQMNLTAICNYTLDISTAWHRIGL
jgi:hypothetical protein